MAAHSQNRRTADSLTRRTSSLRADVRPSARVRGSSSRAPACERILERRASVRAVVNSIIVSLWLSALPRRPGDFRSDPLYGIITELCAVSLGCEAVSTSLHTVYRMAVAGSLQTPLQTSLQTSLQAPLQATFQTEF